MRKLSNNYIICVSFFLIFISADAFSNSNEKIGNLLDNQFIQAVDNNDESQVIDLLKSKNLVNTKGKFGITPLMRAILRNNKKMVTLLINNNANVLDSDSGGATALHIAVRINNPEIINILIDKKSNLNSQDKEGWTPLMRALVNNNIGIIDKLVSSGSDPRISNKSNQSAITQAILDNNLEAVKIFDNYGFLSKEEINEKKLLHLVKNTNSDIYILLNKNYNDSNTIKIAENEDYFTNHHTEISEEDMAVISEGELEQTNKIVYATEIKELLWLNDNVKNQYADYGDPLSLENDIQTATDSEIKSNNEIILSDYKESEKNIESSTNKDDLFQASEYRNSIINNISQEIKNSEIQFENNKIHLTESDLNAFESNKYKQNLVSKIKYNEIKGENFWIELKFHKYKDAENKYNILQKANLPKNIRITINHSIVNKDKSSINVGPITDMSQIAQLSVLLAIKQNDFNYIKLLDKNRY